MLFSWIPSGNISAGCINFLSNSRKKSSGVVKTGFSVSIESFGWKSFRKLTICYFLNIGRKNSAGCRKISAGLSSCFLPLLGNNLKKFFLKSFCIFCGLFFGSFPVIEQEKFLLACQNCILCIYKIFLMKKLFWKTNEIFHHFQTLSRKFSASCRVFRRGCWNCILRVQGNILAKNSFNSKFFFNFGHWAIFLTNSRKKLAELSKLDSQFQWRFSGASLLQNLQNVIFLNTERKYFGWLYKFFEQFSKKK